jgi:hypothetical protein
VVFGGGGRAALLQLGFAGCTRHTSIPCSVLRERLGPAMNPATLDAYVVEMYWFTARFGCAVST